MLDERLSLAARLYEPCELGADIGTDHALLPAHLLEQGICHRMILADISPKALSHAAAQVDRSGLQDRTRLVCADGLEALDEACGCISVLGMGGETLSGLLQRGAERIRGAVLVLSAHTEQEMVRRTIEKLGYHLTREELCLAAGRYYIVWRAEPGCARSNAQELRYGSLLFRQDRELLNGYMRHRVEVLASQLRGLTAAAVPDETRLAEIRQDLAFWRQRLEEQE